MLFCSEHFLRLKSHLLTELFLVYIGSANQLGLGWGRWTEQVVVRYGTGLIILLFYFFTVLYLFLSNTFFLFASIPLSFKRLCVILAQQSFAYLLCITLVILFLRLYQLYFTVSFLISPFQGCWHLNLGLLFERNFKAL